MKSKKIIIKNLIGKIIIIPSDSEGVEEKMINTVLKIFNGVQFVDEDNGSSKSQKESLENDVTMDAPLHYNSNDFKWIQSVGNFLKTTNHSKNEIKQIFDKMRIPNSIKKKEIIRLFDC